jgi:NAD(P)H dehydrogenase (quinone)
VLAESTVPHTLLRNGWYWENYLRGVAPVIESGVLYGAAGDGRVSAAARADYAEAAAVVLTTDGHAGRVYELGGDEHLTYSDLAQVISQTSGKPVSYRDLPEAEYAAALENTGVPAPMAQALADADTGVRNGLLEVTGGDLHKLIGRAPVPAADVFRAGLAS